MLFSLPPTDYFKSYHVSYIGNSTIEYVNIQNWELSRSWSVEKLEFCFGTRNQSNNPINYKKILSSHIHPFMMSKSNDYHFLEIWNATEYLRSFRYHSAANYDGPWIENYWINLLSQKAYTLSMNNDTNLSSQFNIFVPLFIQWTDIAVIRFVYFWGCDQVRRLFDLFESNYIYITVIQHADGVYSWIRECHHNETFMYKWNNIWSKQLITFSAGGWGNVIIPLCAKHNQYYHTTNHSFDVLTSNKTLQITQHVIRNRYQYMLGFAGSYSHPIRSMLTKYFESEIYENESFYIHYHGDDWKIFVSECCNFVLTPRGYGHTSYTVCENIQLGNIPIHIWIDYPWLPYTKLIWNKYSLNFQCNHSVNIWNNKSQNINSINCSDIAPNINQTLYNVWNNKTKLYRIKNWIKMNGDKYFTFKGIINQIKLFMLYGPYNKTKTKKQTMLECIGGYLPNNSVKHTIEKIEGV